MTAALHRSTLALVVALTLAGFALRLYQINDDAIRGDEVFTILHWMREPFGQAVEKLATVVPQPPLAVGIYRAWALLVGPQDSTARFLPALLNLLGIPAIFALGKRLGGRN